MELPVPTNISFATRGSRWPYFATVFGVKCTIPSSEIQTGNFQSRLINRNETSDLEPTIEELGCGWKRILPGFSDQVDIGEFQALVVRGWACPLPTVYPESLHALMKEFQKAGKGIFVEYAPAEDGAAEPV
ncbi:MAG: hypothetical protein PHV34_20455 [Verrucomicrobiae bacterium]|nr:hypothetical protein [Verrucomicrobiae bacterium]